MKLENPFVTNGYAGADYFCDREKETEWLTTLLTNGNNVALISPRRIGKTDLLRHCFSQPTIQAQYHTILIDIYSTTSLADFVEEFGKAIIATLRSKGRKVWERFLEVVSSIRSEISFDINGQPIWGIGLGQVKTPSVTLDEIFTYLNEADKHCLVAIDEFQQITRYHDGPNIEAMLRTYIQRCVNANFVFSGSRRHLMDAIFTSPSRPFYQQVTLMNLPKLTIEKYQPFAASLFENHGKHLDPSVVEQLFPQFDHITAYIQRVMNMLFVLTPEGKTCTPDMTGKAVDILLDYASDTYISLFNQLTEKQRGVLLAIAMEGKAKEVTGGHFIRKHHLVSASSTRSAINILLDRDLITNENGTYQVYDPFFQLWIKQNKQP